MNQHLRRMDGSHFGFRDADGLWLADGSFVGRFRDDEGL